MIVKHFRKIIQKHIRQTLFPSRLNQKKECIDLNSTKLVVLYSVSHIGTVFINNFIRYKIFYFIFFSNGSVTKKQMARNRGGLSHFKKMLPLKRVSVHIFVIFFKYCTQSVISPIIKGRNILTVDLGPPKSATQILRTNEMPDRGVMQPKIELKNFSYDL